MTPQEFFDLVDEFEIAILNNMLWPKVLRIDPEIVKQVFGKGSVKMVKYKLRATAEFIPVEDGKPGEFLIIPTNLQD